MKRLSIRNKALFVFAAFLALCASAAGAPVAPRQAPARAADVRISGEIHRRIELSHAYLLKKSRAIAKNTGWGADQYGRWVEAVGLLGGYLRRDSPEFDRVAAEFLALQQHDGRILIPTLHRREWWGGTRAVNGLMHLYEVRPDAGWLRAAARLADFFLAGAPVPESTDTLIHAGYHSVLEGMVALWRATGEKKYLNFAERVAATIDPEVAPPGAAKLAHRPITSLVKGYAPHQHHTHSYLETVRGIMDLYAATGNRQYLNIGERVWHETLRHTMWVSGGIPEVYGELFEHNDETCPVTSWMLLGLALFRDTGEAAYMDVVEHSLLNHLSFDQGVEGGFYADRSICARERVSPDNRGAVADACCSMHGARGIYEAIPYVYTTDDEGVSVNLFVDSTAELPRGKRRGALGLRLATEYPEHGRVSLAVVSVQDPRDFAIRIRIPGWLRSKPEIRINAASARFERSTAGYAVLQRRWRAGDRIEVRFDLPLALLVSGENGFNAPRRANVSEAGAREFREAALVRGPLVLMIVRERNPGLKGSEFTLAVFEKSDGTLTLTRPGAAAPAGPYSRPGAHLRTGAVADTPVTRADAAGARWQPVLLVPMSEMTGHPVSAADPYKVRNTIVVLPEMSMTDIVRSPAP